MSMLIELRDAQRDSAGPKAGVLGDLLRSGFPVPPGFVIPISVYAEVARGLGLAARPQPAQARSALLRASTPPELTAQVAERLRVLAVESGTTQVAVRSSATTEDLSGFTGAGQHDTVLGVSGTEPVMAAVQTTWASLWSERASAYRGTVGQALRQPAMAVLIQSLVHAAVSGVMFTDGAVRIEAVRGFGDALVSGHVTPDSWLVTDGTVIERRPGNQPQRADRRPRGEEARHWPSTDQVLCLTDQQVLLLTKLGLAIQHHLGQPQDIEWAMTADGRPSILQSRPVTVRMPSASGAHETSTARARPATTSRSASRANERSVVLVGVAAGPGSAKGPARIVRGLDDFAQVRPGDVLVCPTTDPAWTPLFRIAAAVVTEHGGLLCHAAIVAREYGIPAVLAVPTATTALIQGRTVEVDGDRGRVLLQ